MSESALWDDGLVKKKLVVYTDDGPVGIGHYFSNCRRDYEKIRDSIVYNKEQFNTFESAYSAIECIYAVARAFNGQRSAAIKAIGVNKALGYPLSVDELFDMTDKFENKTPAKCFAQFIRHGEYYNRKRVIKCCMIKDPLKYGLGVRIHREEAKRIKIEMREKIRSMSQMQGMTVKEMVRLLKEEGYSVSAKTITRYLNSRGIKWRDYKKAIKEMENEKEEDLDME